MKISDELREFMIGAGFLGVVVFACVVGGFMAHTLDSHFAAPEISEECCPPGSSR